MNAEVAARRDVLREYNALCVALRALRAKLEKLETADETSAAIEQEMCDLVERIAVKQRRAHELYAALYPKEGV